MRHQPRYSTMMKCGIANQQGEATSSAHESLDTCVRQLQGGSVLGRRQNCHKTSAHSRTVHAHKLQAVRAGENETVHVDTKLTPHVHVMCACLHWRAEPINLLAPERVSSKLVPVASCGDGPSHVSLQGRIYLRQGVELTCDKAHCDVLAVFVEIHVAATGLNTRDLLGACYSAPGAAFGAPCCGGLLPLRPSSKSP